MHRYLSTFLLGIALITPVAVSTAQVHVTYKRYYDRNARDYHEWNDNEQRAYNRYQEEQRADQRREWARSNRSQQGLYFKWRHTHPDAVVVVR